MKESRESKLLRQWKIRQEAEGHDVSGVTTLKEAEEFFKKPKHHMDAAQFEDWSYDDVRKLAKDMGIPAIGKKEELIKKICSADVEIEADAILNTDLDEVNAGDDQEEDSEPPEEKEVE